ncbi:MAG TPA: ElyC/SanA/YdcF family protein [Opitutaceae bacterium]|nr:ElyC/SanA/YdcF family protein [Opitutaceae bacterium]
MVPTLLGCIVLLALIGTPIALWTFCGERFLSVTARVPSKILIVEAWMHEDGAHAAAAEFSRPGADYDHVVATGGLTGEHWFRQRWSEVDIVRRELSRLGIESPVFIPAPAPDVESQRTYLNAVSARDALARRGIHPTTIDVLTRGVHARRSRLVFQKVFGPQTKVGVIAWIPPGFDRGHWWDESERAIDFIKESAGYFFEALLSSGRPWHHADDTSAVSPAPSHG